MDDEQLAQQRLMMLNMDPTMHTRYRRLVNKGFTPKMVRDLEQQIVGYADGIIDAVCERGTADFVEEISAELPLLVIAELLGRAPGGPAQGLRLVQPHDRLGGPRVPGRGRRPGRGGHGRLQPTPRSWRPPGGSTPREDLVSVLLNAEVEGEKLDQLELDLFFLLLIVAGNETTRNLMSGAMAAFFDHPDQWEQLRQDRSLLPERRRGDAALRHARSCTSAAPRWPTPSSGARHSQEGDKVVFWHISANRDESVFTDPDTFDIARSPNTHMAFGGGGPHFCLGANLARMEIMVMFDRLLDRIPDIRLDGEVQRLQSNFINGTKHIPVAFAPSAPIGGTPLPARAQRRASDPGHRQPTRRFHQSITFLPTRQAVPLARACDELGYGGIYISDHLFNPASSSPATRTRCARTGRPGWESETAVARPHVRDLRPGHGHRAPHLHHRRLHGPGPGPHHRGQVGRARPPSCRTTGCGSGVGVGWCKEEFDQTGQDFTTRGKRLDEMILALRALWQGGWVEFHGPYYDVPECQIEPSPTAPIPIIGGGHSPAALRRAAALCDGWIAAGAYTEEEAWTHLGALRQRARRRPGRERRALLHLPLPRTSGPTSTCTAGSMDAGVTDFVCAPWMFVTVEPGTPDDKALSDRLAAVRVVRRGDRGQAVTRRSAPTMERDGRGWRHEGHEDRPAARLLGLGSSARRGGTGRGGRAPRLRLGVDGRVLRLRRPHPAGLVGVADHTGAPRAPRSASSRPARRPPWPWPR